MLVFSVVALAFFVTPTRLGSTCSVIELRESPGYLWRVERFAAKVDSATQIVRARTTRADAARHLITFEPIEWLRRMRTAFPLERIGYLVHGYGVAHAHFIIVPQRGPHHLTSDRFAHAVDGNVIFDLTQVPVADHGALDAHARLLSDRAT